MSHMSVVTPRAVPVAPVSYSNMDVVYTQLPQFYPGHTQILLPHRYPTATTTRVPEVEEVKPAVSAVGGAPVPFTTTLVVKRLDQSTPRPTCPTSVMVPAIDGSSHVVLPAHLTLPTPTRNGAPLNGIRRAVFPRMYGLSENAHGSPPSVGSVISSGRSSAASHGSGSSSPSPRPNVGQLDLLADAAMSVAARKNNQGTTKVISKPNARRNSGRRKSPTRPRQGALGTSRSWTPEEDAKLIRLVKLHGAKNWTEIAENFPGRSGKQVRERYINQLDPGLKRSSWTAEEDAAIIAMQAQYGNKWSLMAKLMPGRTDNAIKNRFNSSLRTKPPRRLWIPRRV